MDTGAFWCSAIRGVATSDFCGKRCPYRDHCTDETPWSEEPPERAREKAKQSLEELKEV